MEAEAMYEKLRSHFGDLPVELKRRGGEPFLALGSQRLREVAEYLKGEEALSFDSLMCLSAVDEGENYAVVYHLHSMRHRHRLVLKAHVSRDDPCLPSVQSVWRAANWHEREAYDLLGILFEGHPDMRRILLPEDWPGHPLRKDYIFPEEYDGIPCVRS